jgi:hypothetical protein
VKAALTLNSYPRTLAFEPNYIHTHPHIRIQNPKAISIDIFTFGVIHVNPKVGHDQLVKIQSRPAGPVSALVYLFMLSFLK